ncbi:MAG: PIN domain-containing protein [Nakamurella sp.]
MTGLVVDAGPLYALADRDDAYHRQSLELLGTHPGPLIVPTLVITEVAYFVGRRLGARAEILFAQDLAEGVYSVDPVHAGDWLRVAELVAAYRDFPLGMVDASVIACAERRQLTEIATLDRRHFGAVRPRHRPSFNLLP